MTGPFSKGPIGVRATAPRYFTHADGTPVLLLGKMLDFDSPTPEQFTTFTFFSEQLTDGQRRVELDYQHALGLNLMAIYLFNRGDFGGTEPTNPWVGACPGCDLTRFDLAHWRMYETWMRTLRDEGMPWRNWNKHLTVREPARSLHCA